MPIKKINKQLNSIAQHVSESNPSTENVRSLKYFSTTKKLGKIIRIQALFRPYLSLKFFSLKHTIYTRSRLCGIDVILHVSNTFIRI